MDIISIHLSTPQNTFHKGTYVYLSLVDSSQLATKRTCGTHSKGDTSYSNVETLVIDSPHPPLGNGSCLVLFCLFCSSSTSFLFSGCQRCLWTNTPLPFLVPCRLSAWNALFHFFWWSWSRIFQARWSIVTSFVHFLFLFFLFHSSDGLLLFKFYFLLFFVKDLYIHFQISRKNFPFFS